MTRACLGLARARSDNAACVVPGQEPGGRHERYFFTDMWEAPRRDGREARGIVKTGPRYHHPCHIRAKHAYRQSALHPYRREG